jgi:hypothetical protein
MQSAVPSPLGSHFVQFASFWKEQIELSITASLLKEPIKVHKLQIKLSSINIFSVLKTFLLVQEKRGR